jgi:phospholipase A1
MYFIYEKVSSVTPKITCLLFLLASYSASADESLLLSNSEALKDNQIKTETRVVEVISEDEFDDEVQELPSLMQKLQIEQAASRNPYVLLPHKPNYFLPLTYQRSPSNREVNRALSQFADEPLEVADGFDHPEAIFQLSLKYMLAENVLGPMSRIDLGYTNISYWQVYNGDISRPFRETNHEPEIMLTWGIRDYWVDMIRLSLNHQSNGQNSTLSRSWNRVIVDVASVVDSGVVSMRAWWRIPEANSADPDDPSDDDNPDILEYMGYGELSYLKLMKKHQFEIRVRNNLNFDENRGAVTLGYTFPLTSRVKGYVQYFNGYGESLIDYDRYQERIGVGIKLSDWF